MRSRRFEKRAGRHVRHSAASRASGCEQCLGRSARVITAHHTSTIQHGELASVLARVSHTARVGCRRRARAASIAKGAARDAASCLTIFFLHFHSPFFIFPIGHQDMRHSNRHMLLGLTLVSAVQVLVVVGILQYALPQSVAGAPVCVARHFFVLFQQSLLLLTSTRFVLNDQERSTTPSTEVRP
jgi:hypothetical protein